MQSTSLHEGRMGEKEGTRNLVLGGALGGVPASGGPLLGGVHCQMLREMLLPCPPNSAAEATAPCPEATPPLGVPSAGVGTGPASGKNSCFSFVGAYLQVLPGSSLSCPLLSPSLKGLAAHSHPQQKPPWPGWEKGSHSKLYPHSASIGKLGARPSSRMEHSWVNTYKGVPGYQYFGALPASSAPTALQGESFHAWPPPAGRNR